MADRNEIKQGIQQARSQAGYGTSLVPFHTHDNVNSPYIANQPGYLQFAGAVGSGGTASTPFPARWTVSKPGTGDYLITHNLNTTEYIVLATVNAAAASNTAVITTTSYTSTSFHVQTAAAATSSAVSEPFVFVLFLLNF